MRIAITSQNKKHITKHAGKCRKFWLIDIEDSQVISRQLIELPLDGSIKKSLQFPEFLQDIDTFITSGMGDGLKRRLQSMDIDFEVTEVVLVDDWLAGWLKT